VGATEYIELNTDPERKEESMSRKLIVVGVLCVAIALTVFITYARSKSIPKILNSQDAGQSMSTAVTSGPQSRNLAAQPEAFKLSRRTGGERFRSKTPAGVIMHGLISTATNRQTVQISRFQNDSGERVEVAVAGAASPLSWDPSAGARTATGVLDLASRALLERLTFDSADEFILAQLRGAAYSVVARNVRPDDAPEDYSGALWDVVRVDDPEHDEEKKPLNPWRLYYINTRTGLIDKIAYDSQGDRIEVNFVDWADQQGEKFPSTITWTSHGQTLLTFNLATVSFVAK
jgi:hypothetical protein